MKKRVALFAFFLLFGSEVHGFASARRVAPDAVSESSHVDGDATALAEGCGQQPSSLGLFCRMQEGDASNRSLWFIGPPAECNREEACVYVKVWSSQGQLVFGSFIPKTQTRIEVSWETLLGRDTFELADRGFWTFTTQVFWVDSDGRDRESMSQGDIVLRVYRNGYLPLHNVASDPNFVWRWSEGGFTYRVTSALRAFVSRDRSI